MIYRTKRNRGFIGDALSRAVKEIHRDPEIEVEPAIDRDVMGIPGSPDIAHTIFAKIKDAEVFVGDVSIINPGAPRPTPNPNVIIELGYAMGVIGPERIIMVLNTAYGGPELLPFDLRGRIMVVYKMAEDCDERGGPRKDLARRFETALRGIFADRNRILGDLTPLDNEIFAEICDETLRRDYKFVQRNLFLPLREKYGEKEFDEAMRMLEARGHIKATWAGGGLIYSAVVEPASFDLYARKRVKDYREKKQYVARRLIENSRLSSGDIAKELNAPKMLVRLIYLALTGEGLLRASGDFTVWTDWVSPELSRRLRARSI